MRRARAAGLRPRSAYLKLATAAGLATLALEGLARRAPGALRDQLAGALTGEPARLEVTPLVELARLAGLGLLALFAAALIVLALRGRRPRARELGVDPELGEIHPALGLGLCAGALMLGALVLRPSLAGAARAVDADLAGLISLWTLAPRRALLGLVAIAAGLGVIERLASARRLWQGLHMTPEQAREDARGEGRRR